MPPSTTNELAVPFAMKVTRSESATCFIVPASFMTIRSADVSVIEVADVSPSIMFSSAVVTVAPFD